MLKLAAAQNSCQVMSFTFRSLTQCCSQNGTTLSRTASRAAKIKRWSKNVFFVYKNNVESIADGDRWCVEIRQATPV